MTYFDAVSYIRKLRYGTLSNEQIQNLNNFKCDTSNITIRYTNQIINLIEFRLNNTLNLFIKKLYEANLDYNGIILEVNYIKQEIRTAKLLLEVNVITEDTRNKLLNSVADFANQVEVALKKGFAMLGLCSY